MSYITALRAALHLSSDLLPLMPDEPLPSQDPDLWSSASNPGAEQPASSNSAEEASGHEAAPDEELWDDPVVADQESEFLLRPKSQESLLRLREQVETAAEELARLRRENRALRERLEELESQLPGSPTEGTMLMVDEDPESAKRKVKHFIDSIDRYLARHQTPSH